MFLFQNAFGNLRKMFVFCNFVCSFKNCFYFKFCSQFSRMCLFLILCASFKKCSIFFRNANEFEKCSSFFLVFLLILSCSFFLFRIFHSSKKCSWFDKTVHISQKMFENFKKCLSFSNFVLSLKKVLVSKIVDGFQNYSHFQIIVQCFKKYCL